MTLRGKKGADGSLSDGESTIQARSMGGIDNTSAKVGDAKGTLLPVSETSDLGSPDSHQKSLTQGTQSGLLASTGKKLPRVILHVRPPAD